LWGKLCQNDITHEFGYITNEKQLYDLLHNPIVKDQSVQFRWVDEMKVEYRCELNDAGAQRSSAYNIYIASIVTSAAREILHKAIDGVRADGGEVLYCDTD